MRFPGGAALIAALLIAPSVAVPDETASGATSSVTQPETPAPAGVAVSGVVLRAPASVASPPPPARYRSRRAQRAEDEPSPAECGCDPGRFAVVHLTGENLPPPRLPLAPPVMAQKDRSFEPSVIVIPVGGEGGFPN